MSEHKIGDTVRIREDIETTSIGWPVSHAGQSGKIIKDNSDIYKAPVFCVKFDDGDAFSIHAGWFAK